MRPEEPARAKINLALHVRRRRADGYHEIETLFAFCEAGDAVAIGDADAPLTIDGPFAAGLSTTDNLILRAVAALRDASGVEASVALTLKKNLPVASGIGGGSADAAAVLRLLNRVWGLDWPLAKLAEVAVPLGADVPACVWSRTMRGEGLGEALTPVEAGLSGTPVLLVNPGVAVPTAAVFAAWDGIDRGAMPGDPLAGRNDLEAPALALQPVIGDVLAALRATGPRVARMSGSGATCFALFDGDAASAIAASAIAAAHPGWWIMPTRLV